MKIQINRYTTPQMKDFVFQISIRGGTCRLVGGAVIDILRYSPPKDWDIEVYGVDQEKIQSALLCIGATYDTVGKSFGVIKTRLGSEYVDISLPRKESKTGVGHRGFLVETDPFLDPKEAARRRDLTINSMSINMHNGELEDYFGGLKDLKRGIIRATDAKTFLEDPLRVLRVMQLLARKGNKVDMMTIGLCSGMVDDFKELPKERVFEEFCKLLYMSEKPSMGLKFLKVCGWLKHFPELYDLIGCPQHPEWHPEGDVWTHTLMVIDNAAALRSTVAKEKRLAYMFAALLHDIGKPATTKEDFTSHGHDEVGAVLAETFMRRLTNDSQLIADVVNMVRLHMRPGQLVRSDAGNSAWRRLANEFDIRTLGYLCWADSAGRLNRNINIAPDSANKCFEVACNRPKQKEDPLVMGRDLIALGMTPGREFSVTLAKAYDLQLDGLDKEEILKQIL